MALAEARPVSLALADGAARHSFARIAEVAPIPNLIKVQRDSFEWFTREGLKELFAEISPIQDFTGRNMDLELAVPGPDGEPGYSFGQPKMSEDDCREHDLTYAAPLKVRMRLKIKSGENAGEIKEQDIFMGDFPLMTDNGTFIINGAERVVVSQLVRSPGVYFTVEEDPTSGRDLCMGKLIPSRGAWLEFETSSRDVMSVKVDRKRKIPVTTLLRALPRVVPDFKAVARGTNEEILALFEGVDEGNDRHFVQSTLHKDPAANAEEALLEFYRRLRPGDPPNADNARSLLNSLFFNFRRYDLGKVGRYKVNKRLGLQTEITVRILTPDDLVEIVREMVRINHGKGTADDIDHLGNRRVRAVGELIQNQFRVGLLRMERVVKERMSITDPATATPSSLTNIRPVVASMREFFGGSQLSQFMDQTNPLAELTHKRRLSALGPGGLSRDRAGFEVRDVHHSHYGRLCTIETPEGPNIGLISTLCVHAKINEMGFIETPYHKVDNGKVDLKKLTYLSAEEEDIAKIAQANIALDEKGNFVEDKIVSRQTGDFPILDRNEVEFMDVAPNQIVGLSASLIPFLEHDDANRALMGSNMQRQAVPLIRPDVPIVGTGLESKAARDARIQIHSDGNGIVEFVDANEIHVRYDRDAEEKLVSFEDDLRIYKLTKFIKTNQETCINLKPAVKKGQKVKKGDFLTEGYATQNGEIALGKNLKVAFMPWKGYNFEDAIVISERVVKEDLFTSVHISEYELEVRDTKLGEEELTPDIPNVSEEATKDLDENGIIRIGAQIKEGDIIIGKITPKGESDPTPEEKLLRAIFGDKAGDAKDASLKAPNGVEGVVISKKLFQRAKKDKNAKVREKAALEKLEKLHEKNVEELKDLLLNKLQVLLKEHSSAGVSNNFGEVLIGKGAKFTAKNLSGIDYLNVNPLGWTGEAK